MVDFKFDLQLFGGGGGGKGGESSSSSSYTPSAEEQKILGYMADNAESAETGIKSMLNQFNTGVQSDYFNSILGNANNMVSSGQNLYSSLANGELPTAYKENMSDAIKSGVQNTVGSATASLGNRGVLNSSVTNKAMNDIQQNVSNTMAQQYTNNINTLGNLAGSQISSATAGYSPYSSLAQLAGYQQNTYLNTPVGAMRGTGTTTRTNNSGGVGSTLLNAGLGLATGWGAKQMGLKFF